MNLNSVFTAGLIVMTSFAAQASCLDLFNLRISNLRDDASYKQNNAGLMAAIGSATVGAGYVSVLAVPPVAIVTGGAAVSAGGLLYSSSNSRAQAQNLIAVRDLIAEAQIGTGLNLISIAEKSKTSLEFVADTVNDLDSKNAFCPNGDLLTGAQAVELISKQMTYTR